MVGQLKPLVLKGFLHTAKARALVGEASAKGRLSATHDKALMTEESSPGLCDHEADEAVIQLLSQGLSTAMRNGWN